MMNPEENDKNNEKSNYKPSRFLQKKQQALIHQGFFFISSPNSHFFIKKSSKIKIIEN